MTKAVLLFEKSVLAGILMGLIVMIAVLQAGCQGCQDDGCRTNSDCPGGKICQGGKCVDIEEDTESGDSDGDADGDGDVDGDVDGDTDGDTDADGDSDTDTGSEPDDTGDVCEGILDNGESCADNCECMSGHCEGGVCCAEGECCATPDDCDNDMCLARACDGNSQCNYGVAGFTCGVSDDDGVQTCDGGNVCNGDGACVPVTTDCGFFAVASYSCSETEATAACYTSCDAQNVRVNCIEGATCENDICVGNGGLEDGAACTEDSACSSGHCGDGFCCPGNGECCGTVADCSDTLCNTVVCTESEHRCITSLTGFPCGGTDDADGDVCHGENRCDGAGECVPFTACTGAYGWDGTYDCSASDVVEGCNTSCAGDGDCNREAGYTDCVDGECVFVGLSDGEPCAEDTACNSGHCQNGFCCLMGDCCQDTVDCPDGLCGDTVCDVNAMCGVEALIPVGGEDTVGANTCEGDSRCNGAGDCVAITSTCDDAYTTDGTYSSSGDELVENCYDACGNDMQCNDGYFCDESLCKSVGLGEDGDPCTANDECLSDNCDSNVCCTAGESCCQTAADCDDGIDCTLDACSSDNRCVWGALAEGDLCGDDTDFCNGEERCDASGACVAGPPPCGTDLPCSEEVCNEATDTCDLEVIVDMIDELCSDALWCLDGRQMVCDAYGQCVDPNPGAGTACNSSDPCNPQTCDEESQQCITETLSDGSYCDDGDPCTGDDNTCQSGVCVIGEFPPCDDGNPCTADACTADGDAVTCVNDPIADDEPCEPGLYCYGSAPVCQSGECIPNEDVCDDGNGLCSYYECQEVYYDDFECGNPVNPQGTVVECGTPVTLDTGNEFPARTNFDYAGACSGTYPGPEGMFVALVPEGGEVTVSVSNVSPAMTVHLLFLDDWCDVSTCEVESSNGTLTFNADPGGNVVLMEAEGPLPPESLDVTVTCP